MAGGRPCECSQEVVDLARDYAVNYADYGDTVPTIAGLACESKKHRETLMNWANSGEKPDCTNQLLVEFFDIYKEIMAAQERKLVNGGLSGGFNPAVTKMILTKHGYSDKQEIDSKSTDGSMSPAGNTFDSTQYEKAQEKLRAKVDK